MVSHRSGPGLPSVRVPISPEPIRPQNSKKTVKLGTLGSLGAKKDSLVGTLVSDETSVAETLPDQESTEKAVKLPRPFNGFRISTALRKPEADKKTPKAQLPRTKLRRITRKQKVIYKNTMKKVLETQE